MMGAAEWMVVKFMPDLLRQEPVNVGLMLETPAGRRARFQGERVDGTIDGRKVRALDSADNWRRWVRYWRWMFIDENRPSVELTGANESSNFVVLPGGRQLIGDVPDPDALLDDLYGVLVESASAALAAEPGDEPRRNLHDRVLTLVTDAGLRLDEHFHFEYQVELAAGRGAHTFPYAWANGATTVGYEARAEPDQLDLAAYRLALTPPDYSAIVFVDKEPDRADGSYRTLREIAHVAPVDEVSAADVAEMFRDAAPARRHLTLAPDDDPGVGAWRGHPGD